MVEEGRDPGPAHGNLASRFGVILTDKMAAEMIPIIGALVVRRSISFSSVTFKRRAGAFHRPPLGEKVRSRVCARRI